MYGKDLSLQLQNLMPALGIGFLLAFVYDAVRLLRLLLSQGRIFTFITDMIYVIFVALSSFVLFLAVNSGHIRGYMILAEIFAAAVYRLTAGVLVGSAFSMAAQLIRKVFLKIFTPLCDLYERIRYVSEKILRYLAKKLKKVKINSKKDLQQTEDMLYNKQ